MDKVRVGIVGLGNMGSGHVRHCEKSEYLDLVAICDTDQSALDRVGSEIVAERFSDFDEMTGKADLEAVIIATPHYDHTPLSIAAFESGLHVMCEKPIGVHVKDVRKTISAYEAARAKNPRLKFGAMFQQRTFESWKTIRSMITDGVLGELIRATWIITDSFRTQHYYDNGSWRATWAGEGGGVLLNQAPHNLDLYQWFFGMPEQILGVAEIGGYHRIEVEDAVTAVFRHANGLTGHFITTTAESPGTNRLEIVGENGRLIFNDGTLTFDRNETSMFEFSRTVKEGFARVPSTAETIEVPPHPTGAHLIVSEAFARAVREDTPLVAEGPEGLGSVMLANGILMSHFSGSPVTLPLDEDAYENHLRTLIENSTFSK